MLMILHLVNDEKVIDRTIDHFETVFPNNNFVVCFSSPETKHVTLKTNIAFYHENILSCDVDFSKIKKVFIHYLTLEKIDFCNKYLNNVKIYWCVWGGDIYHSLLASKGYKLYSHNTIKAMGALNFFDYIKYLIKFRITRYRKYMDFINHKVNYISIDENEFSILKNKLKISKRIKRFEFFYYPIDYILGTELIDKKIDTSSTNINILCGNSGSYTNNHIDTLKILYELRKDNFNIVMPLSYGGSEKYIKNVIKKGKKLFREYFRPLINFIPITEYNKIQYTAPICVYSNWRKEAFGNIVISLYLGAKIYFTKKNPYINTLRELGCKVFVLENVAKEDFYKPLSEEDKLINKKIMIEQYNFERLLSLIQKNFQ